MNEFFIVWLISAGQFGFKAEKSVSAACETAKEKKGQVFKLKDPNYRYAVSCSTLDCNFPGWVTVPVKCHKVYETIEKMPSHWEIEEVLK